MYYNPREKSAVSLVRFPEEPPPPAPPFYSLIDWAWNIIWQNDNHFCPDSPPIHIYYKHIVDCGKFVLQSFSTIFISMMII